MRIVAVFQGKGVKNLPRNWPSELGFNPPLDPSEIPKIQNIGRQVRSSSGSYDALCSSPTMCALSTASVLIQEIDSLNITTVDRLGRHAYQDGNRTVVAPGYEHDSCDEWQNQGLAALAEISATLLGATVLVVSDRFIIGSLVAFARGITDEAGIEAIVNDPDLIRDGFVIFNTTDGRRLEIVNAA